MILQAGDPIVTELVKTIGVPLAQLLIAVVLIKKYVMPQANGKSDEGLALLTKTMAGEFKHLEQAQDLTVTEHFDQLRRDLTTTIERQEQLTRDDLRNALATMTLELELGRLREGDK